MAVVVLLGGLFVFLAVKRMLSLLQLDYTLYVFNQFEPFIRKICAAIVDKAEKSTEKVVTVDQVKGVFNSFIPKIPPVFQKSIVAITLSSTRRRFRSRNLSYSSAWYLWEAQW